MNFFDSIFGGKKAEQQSQSQQGSAQQSTQESEQQSQQGAFQNSEQQSNQQSNSLSNQLSNQQSTSTGFDINDPAFKGLRDPFSAALAGLLNGGTPQYGGPLTTAAGGNENSVLSQLMGMTGPNTGRSDLLNATMNGNFLPGQAGSNPFLQAAITAAQRPTMQNLEETLSRSLPGRFTQAGQMVQPQGSSAFDRAAAIATRGAAQTMGDIATNMSSNAYGQERGLQQQAVGLSQQEVQSSIQNLQAQALPRMIQELGIDRGLQLFQQKTASLLDILKTIAGVTGPVVANTAQSTGTSMGTSVGSSTGASTGFSVGGSQGTSTGTSRGQSTGQSYGTSTGTGQSYETGGVLGALSKFLKPIGIG